MPPPIVCPGAFAERWSVTFPLLNGSNTARLILPSISFGGPEPPVLRPLIHPEGIETSRQLDDGLGAATSGTGGSELEDVIIEERDPVSGSPRVQPNLLTSASTSPGFGPSLSGVSTKTCFKNLCSQKGNRMVRQVHTDKNRRAPYFWSTSTDRIARPPALHVSCELAVGDVFVHEVVNHGLQVWVLDPACNGQAHWEPVYLLPNRRHPEDPTLFLSFPTPTGLNSKRAPTWVKESTAKRHKSHLPNILIDE